MQTKFLHIKTLLAATGVAASLVAAGCGNDSQADLINGKQLFTEKCGACHTLARAPSAKGVVGPNLDKAFGPARAAGMTSSTIQGVVTGQIKHPSQRLATQLRMPPN